MPIRQEESDWRAKRFEWYGQPIFEHITANYRMGEYFAIRDVADSVVCLEDKSRRYSYDIAAAVLRELTLRREIRKCGRLFTRKKTETMVPAERRKKYEPKTASRRVGAAQSDGKIRREQGFSRRVSG